MTKLTSTNQQTLEFQLELMMVHLEQMNKRLDMLEKTCVSLMEKNNAAPPSVCPYHAQQINAQQHLEKRIQHDRQQEQSQSNTSSSHPPPPPAKINLQRRAAM